MVVFSEFFLNIFFLTQHIERSTSFGSLTKDRSTFIISKKHQVAKLYIIFVFSVTLLKALISVKQVMTKTSFLKSF